MALERNLVAMITKHGGGRTYSAITCTSQVFPTPLVCASRRCQLALRTMIPLDVGLQIPHGAPALLHSTLPGVRSRCNAPPCLGPSYRSW